MGQDPATAVRTAQAVAARVVMQRGALVLPAALRQAAGLPVRAG
jgi:sugar/nucleoside kinase (ribokinase family)